MIASTFLFALLAASSFAAPTPLTNEVVTISNSTISKANVSPMYQRGRAGACGQVHYDQDLVVGIPLEFWPVTSSPSPLCGSYITIVNPADNSSVVALIADASGMSNLLSLSIGTYQALHGASTVFDSANWSFNTNQTVAALAASLSASSIIASSTAAAPSSTIAPVVVAPTSTSIYVAPTPTYVAPSSTYVAPSSTYVAPSSTYVAPSSSSSAAYVAPTSSASSFDYSGKATYYNQEGGIGSCGTAHSDSDFIVAVDVANYDASKCGKSLRITRPSTGASVVAIMADKCPGCPSAGSLDLSVAAFNALGSEAEGVFAISWSWIN